MSAEDVLLDLQSKIEDNLPPEVSVTGVGFEGPQLVIYTEEPRKFADDGKIIRNLAKVLRMRIAVRPDPKVLLDPETSIRLIDKIVPEDAGIENHFFDPDSGEVIIEAEKPGLVIGKHGDTLRDITKEIGWMPKVVRAPPIKSKTVKDVRDFMRFHLNERRDLMANIGRKIHRQAHHPDQWVRVTSLGGAMEVGRSCYLLSTPESKIMIDCGVNVGSDENMSPYLYVPEINDFNELDAIVLTHAHMDHQGLVPLLFKYGYRGPVYCTPPTRDMTILLQLDYLDVSQKEGKRPPYDREAIEQQLLHMIPLDYEEVTDIAPDMKLTFHNAGHIIGSAVSHFHIGDGLHNIVFTGDYKYEKTRLFDPAVNKFPRVETVVTEATYGSNAGTQPSLRVAEKNLQNIIKTTLDRKGTVLIPAFAVGRSQEVMIVLEESIRKGIIPNVPVYLDGMIWEATAIHAAHPEYLNAELKKQIFQKGRNPFLSESFRPVDSKEIRDKIIEEKEPCIIIATSGMMNGGPIMTYFSKMASDELNTIIFVGYQAEGTVGRRIQKGWKEIPMGDETVKVNMQVETVDGFSGHSDNRQLMDYIRRMQPKPEKVFTIHGDEKSCKELADSILRKLRIESKSLVNLETVRII
ncbi:MAG: beta-CASP ribonuclease aCPSF1 [Methanosarcinaceae archaeon]|mgnify:CR=1 FL=1|nr:beta-CASP ribonuclease aCPSF1 [Methanosarcinaceae archaeon]